MDTTVQQAVREAAIVVDPAALPIVLRLRPVLDLTDDQLLAICEINHETWIERTSQGELLLMPPEGGQTAAHSAEITRQLGNWAKDDGTGIFFGSSAGFRLPNGAMRSPDAAWIARSRWDQIPVEEQRKFPPICPDFVIELRSPTDRLRVLQDKMQEYLANGARLGWLIDPGPRHVHVYYPGAPVEGLDNPDTVSGDLVLPGFTLYLRDFW